MKKILPSIVLCVFVAISVSAQTTAFTYQGSLQSGGAPANGNYDFELKLFDLVSSGTQQGNTIQRLNVAVANGSFKVQLDFGAAALPGADRFLDIAVRPAGAGSFTTLAPRQQVNSVPYSVKSLSSTTADVATNATQLGGVAANQYVVTSDPRMTDSRSPTGGSANYIQNQSASPQASSNFNISGNGVINGTLGIGTASPGTTLDVRIAGASAGLRVKSTFSNSSLFLDRAASVVNNTAQLTFLTAGNADFSMGTSQGSAAASDFSIYNYGAANNAFTIQRSSGNVGIGTTTPNFRFEVNSTQNNQFAALIRNLGSPTDASYGLLVRGGTSANDTAFETDDIAGNTLLRVKGNGFTGIGVNNPQYRLHVVEPTLGNFGGLISGDYGLRLTGTHVALLATSPGTSLQVGGGVTASGGLFTDMLIASGNASIGGFETINGNQTVQGDAVFNGRVTINNQPNGGVPICYAYSSNFFTQCASSKRFKKNINDFNRGLDLIRSLRPVTFDWKSDDRHDIGLIAEEVESVEPLLTTHLMDGQIQGVRYDLISVALINAVKEQQSQIEAQKAEIEALKAAICEIKPTATVCKK